MGMVVRMNIRGNLTLKSYDMSPFSVRGVLRWRWINTHTADLFALECQDAEYVRSKNIRIIFAATATTVRRIFVLANMAHPVDRTRGFPL